MRTLLLVILVLGIPAVMWGCSDRKPESAAVIAGTQPVINAGEFHNDVLKAVHRRVPVSSLPGMKWNAWVETALASLEEVSSAQGIPFERERAAAEMMALAQVFSMLEKATGIDPGMLGESEAPEADLDILIAQLKDWGWIDGTTAALVSSFAHSGTTAVSLPAMDAALQDVFEIGAASRAFWSDYSKRERHVAPSPGRMTTDDEGPCKKCWGQSVSDFFGGLTGYLVCGGDPMCRSRMAAEASFIYDVATGHCADHNCFGDGWYPPILPPIILP